MTVYTLDQAFQLPAAKLGPFGDRQFVRLCPVCKQPPTKDFQTLEQGMSIVGVAFCQCGAYSLVVD